MEQINRLIELIKESEFYGENECIDCQNVELCNKCSFHLDMSKLADYLLANGVIVPPCKVGDTVYLPRKNDWGDILSYEVIEVGIDRDGLFFVIDDEDQEHILIDEIGEEVFLTREEAEKALEEMKKYE